MRPILPALLLAATLLCAADKNPNTASTVSPPDEKSHSTGAEEQNISAEDEKLRLMFQVFTYASDLKNAYKVGSKALKRYPDSLYWHQKMAEICQWLDKRGEAVRHYRFIYRHTHDKKLEKKILDYALNAYQYETAAPILKTIALTEPTKENLKKVIDIYDKIGSPEKAAQLLEQIAEADQSSGEWALLKALQIYVEMGEEARARKLVKKLEKSGSYDLQTGEAIADYYLARKNISASYQALQRVRPDTLGTYAATYYRRMSDTGWYLQKPGASAAASSSLIGLKKAKLIDYERIIAFFKGKKPDLVEKVARAGYRKFGKKYLYLTYLETLFAQKEYGKLIEAIKTLPDTEMRRALAGDVNTWMMLAQAYGESGQEERAADAFSRALSLDPDNTGIQTAILWYAIDHKRIRELKKMIFEMEERGDIPKALWLPLAVGNFSLQRADRAMRYIKQLMAAGENGIDIKFMYAYLMQAREETGAFMMTMEDIFDILEEKRRKTPSLMQNAAFLENYLKAGIYFLPVDIFEARLRKAKALLSPKVFTEISIFQALRHNAQDRAKFLAARLREVEPWMQLNIALSDGDRSDEETLLYRYYTILPIRDRVTAAVDTGNIALSQTLAFDGLRQNRYDYLLYQQMRDLVENYADKVTLEGGMQQRSELERNWTSFSARYYLDEAWGLFGGVDLVQNRIRNHETLLQAPAEERRFRIGLKRRFMKGDFSLEGGLRNAMKHNPFMEAKFHYQPISRFSIDAAIGLGTLSDETTYLLIGGKKNGIELKGSFQYLPSSTLSLELDAKRFYSQDNVYLGKGLHARLEWYRQLHSGYPDLAMGLFAEYGWYSETDGPAGVIDQIVFYDDTLILPETFYTVGGSFYYGMANKEYFTRVWRPYASISPYYNGLLKQLSFSFDAGVGGEIYDRDHLNFGISYDHSVNGTQESNLQIYIRYRHFFQ